MTNPYINNENPNEQDLLEDLINESINIHGQKFYYITRTLSTDPEIDIFNEDRNSIFQHAFEFTGYIENANTVLEGNGYMMQKFGAIVDYNATITVSHREWNKRVGFHGKSILPDSPASGDLIYYPLTDQLFQIQYVNDKTEPFAQLGRFYTYRLSISLFQYSSQHINTGLGEIDTFETLKTFDTNADNSKWGGVVGFDIVDPGDGYQEIPEIVVDSLTGSGCSLFVDLNEENGSINDIVINDPGFGYHSDDKAYVIGRCTHKAVVVPVIRTVVENAGSGYGTNQPNLSKAREITKIDFDNSPFGPPTYNDGFEQVFGPIPPCCKQRDDSDVQVGDDNFGLNKL